MSKAIVINVTAIQRMFNSIRSKMTAIRSAGFPKEIADMSLPGVGFMTVSPLLADHPLLDFPMSVDSPIPLSLVEYKPGNMGSYMPENLLLEGDPKRKMIPATLAVQTFKRPVESNSRASAEKHCEGITVSTTQPQTSVDIVYKQDKSTDDDIIANSIIVAMKENNLEIKEPETISPGITRITLDEMLGQRNIRIPEYVMVRR